MRKPLTSTRRFDEDLEWLERDLARCELIQENLDCFVRCFERDAARYVGVADLQPYRDRMNAVLDAFARGEGRFTID